MELDPVELITTGAVGEPGQRTFYIQAKQGERLVTLLVEKQQIELLATSILEILARVGEETEEGPKGNDLELIPPLEPLWRVGRLSIGYEESRDMVLLELEELVEGQEAIEDEEPEASELGSEEAAPDEPAGDRIRVWATRAQMLALSRHGAAVAARGRPACQFCGNPMDPDGHTCPAMNGHRGPSRT